MKITRETMRADGLTVGEAMDRDAAFLRSVGIPAKNGAPTFDESEDAFVDKVRSAVLDALDSCVRDGKGWTDQDLPGIFPAIDSHAKMIFSRKEGNP